MTTFWCKACSLLLGATLAFPTVLPSQTADGLFEGFIDVPGLALKDWVFVDNSSPLSNLNSWFQGEVPAFGANSPPANSYAGSSFASVNIRQQAASYTLSNWLLTPELTLVNGAVFSFFTRSVSAPTFPDRMQVRLSISGASTDVGTGPESLGVFGFPGALLFDINEGLEPDGFPADWLQYSVTLSGLQEPSSGRFAFRHYVPDADVNGLYIGIDDVSYRVAPMQVPEPSGLALLFASTLGLAVVAHRGRVTR